jgi:hypothetical protein
MEMLCAQMQVTSPYVLCSTCGLDLIPRWPPDVDLEHAVQLNIQFVIQGRRSYLLA